MVKWLVVFWKQRHRNYKMERILHRLLTKYDQIDHVAVQFGHCAIHKNSQKVTIAIVAFGTAVGA
jgi:hypothetical protein